jgi:hypothetical protein
VCWGGTPKIIARVDFIARPPRLRIQFRFQMAGSLLTLKHAADYITKLPKKESDLAEWQTAIELLLLVSRGGPTMMARMGVMNALNRGVERVFNTDAKEHHWAKRKLKKDQ